MGQSSLSLLPRGSNANMSSSRAGPCGMAGPTARRGSPQKNIFGGSDHKKCSANFSVLRGLGEDSRNATQKINPSLLERSETKAPVLLPSEAGVTVSKCWVGGLFHPKDPSARTPLCFSLTWAHPGANLQRGYRKEGMRTSETPWEKGSHHRLVHKKWSRFSE